MSWACKASRPGRSRAPVGLGESQPQVDRTDQRESSGRSPWRWSISPACARAVSALAGACEPPGQEDDFSNPGVESQLALRARTVHAQAIRNGAGLSRLGHGKGLPSYGSSSVSSGDHAEWLHRDLDGPLVLFRMMQVSGLSMSRMKRDQGCCMWWPPWLLSSH